MGLLRDGYFSLKRYFLAHFFDGQKQDAYDLYYGNFRPKAETKSPFYPLPRTNLFLSLIICSFFTGLAFIFISCYSTKWFYSLLVGFSITALTIRGYYFFGLQFIRYPQLCNEYSSIKKSFPSSISKKGFVNNKLGKVHVV